MRTLFALFLTFLMITSCSHSAKLQNSQDDVYYSKYESNVDSSQQRDKSNWSSQTDFNYDDYYDYSYTSRIRRFHSINRWSYYDPYFTNIYYYDYDPLFWGNSIYLGYSWWSPVNTTTVWFGNYNTWYRPHYRPWIYYNSWYWSNQSGWWNYNVYNWGFYNQYPLFNNWYFSNCYNYNRPYNSYYNVNTITYYGPRRQQSSTTTNQNNNSNTSQIRPNTNYNSNTSSKTISKPTENEYIRTNGLSSKPKTETVYRPNQVSNKQTGSGQFSNQQRPIRTEQQISRPVSDWQKPVQSNTFKPIDRPVSRPVQNISRPSRNISPSIKFSPSRVISPSMKR